MGEGDRPGDEKLSEVLKSIKKLEASLTGAEESLKRTPFQAARAGTIPIPGFSEFVTLLTNLAGKAPGEDLSAYGGTGRGKDAPPSSVELARRYGTPYMQDRGAFAMPGTPGAAGGDLFRVLRLSGLGAFTTIKQLNEGILDAVKHWGGLRNMPVQFRDQLVLTHATLSETRGPEAAKKAFEGVDMSLRGLGHTQSQAAARIKHAISMHERLGETLETTVKRQNTLADAWVASAPHAAEMTSYIGNLSRVTGIADTKLIGVARGFQGFRESAEAAQLMNVLTGQQIGIGDVLGADPASILKQIGGPLRERYRDPAEFQTREGQFQLELIGKIAKGLSKTEIMRFIFRDPIAMETLEIESIPALAAFNKDARGHVSRVFSKVLHDLKRDFELGDPDMARIRMRYAGALRAMIDQGMTLPILSKLELATANIGRLGAAVNNKLIASSKLYSMLNVFLNMIDMPHDKMRNLLEFGTAAMILGQGGPAKGDAWAARVAPQLASIQNALKTLGHDKEFAALLAKWTRMTQGQGGAGDRKAAAEEIAGYAKEIYNSALGQAVQNILVKFMIDGDELKSKLSEVIIQ